MFCRWCSTERDKQPVYDLWLMRDSLPNIQWLNSCYNCKQKRHRLILSSQRKPLKKKKKLSLSFIAHSRHTHRHSREKMGIETSARRQRENLQLWRNAASIWGLIMCVMSSPSCVRAPALAVPAAAPPPSRHQRHHLHTTHPVFHLHQNTRHLIKKLHAPRRFHLIHRTKINPQINVFEGQRGTVGALLLRSANRLCFKKKKKI